MLRSISMASLVVMAACAMEVGGEDEDADPVDVGILASKQDANSIFGTFRLANGGKLTNDIADLQLRGDGTYVRMRCYEASCARKVPETDEFKLVKAADGRTFIRFMRFKWGGTNGMVVKELLNDAYEYKRTATGLSLRKTYTSRWFTLDTATNQQLCSGSGGTWSPTKSLDGAEAGTTTHCDCGQDPNKWPSPQFVPGAGGCLARPALGEDRCDSTGGHYLDDDRNALGDYCLCPIHTRPTGNGCVAF